MYPFDRKIPRGTFLDPLLTGGAVARALLINSRTGETIATTIEPAIDSKTRGKGLLGRTHFAQGSAMIIAPCSSVHTFFMKFAIDVVFVKADGRITKIARELKPWRMAASLGALAAVELPAGAGERIQVGDLLDVKRNTKITETQRTQKP